MLNSVLNPPLAVTVNEDPMVGVKFVLTAKVPARLAAPDTARFPNPVAAPRSAVRVPPAVCV